MVVGVNGDMGSTNVAGEVRTQDHLISGREIIPTIEDLIHCTSLDPVYPLTVGDQLCVALKWWILFVRIEGINERSGRGIEKDEVRESGADQRIADEGHAAEVTDTDRSTITAVWGMQGNHLATHTLVSRNG